MRKNSLIFLAIIGLLFLVSPSGKAEAAECCSTSGSCTITTNPCTVSSPSYTLNGLNINVDSTSVIQIILKNDASFTLGGTANFENQSAMAGASKAIKISGAVPAGQTKNAYSFSLAATNLIFPSGGMTIDLSVDPASTGNGGNLSLKASGITNPPPFADLKVYTYAGNAANGAPTKGGDVNVDVSSVAYFGDNSIIQTGTMLGNPTDGGNIIVDTSGDMKVAGPVGFLNSSSSRYGGNINLDYSGFFRGGLHANGGVKGGLIGIKGSGNYYSPACGPVPALEASSGGEIFIKSSGIIDLPSDTTTGGGKLSVTTSGGMSDPTCATNGSACNSALKANNGLVNIICGACGGGSAVPHCYNPYPGVLNVTSSNADGFYKTGAVINILVKFNGPVAVTGTPNLELETGAAKELANYISGTGTDTLIFRYIVQSGDYSDDLDYLDVNSLSLNGGSIMDLKNVNNAVLNLPAPGAARSLGANKDIVIDTKLPSAGVAAFDKNNTAISNGGSVTTANAAIIKFVSSGWDAPPPTLSGLLSHVVNWTTDNWVTTNSVDCGSSGSCQVRIDAASTQYSINNGITWLNCAANPACSIISPKNPLSGSVQYKSIVTDLALNSIVSGPKSFSVPIAGAFDYSFPNPSGITVTQGGNDSTNLIVTLTSGTTQPVNFSIGALPAGVTVSWPSGTSCNPNCWVTLNVATTSATPSGTYTVNLKSSSAGVLDKTAALSLVVNDAPSVSPVADTLSVSYNNNCLNPAYIFKWRFTDPDVLDKESKYRIQIDTDAGFTAPVTIDRTINLAPPGNNPGFNTLQIPLDLSSPPNPLKANRLAYGKVTYYWRVMVWDNHNTASGWAVAASSFKTPDHRPPRVAFTPPDPSLILLNTPIEFKTDNPAPNDSKCYKSGNIPSATCDWAWDFDGNGSADYFKNDSPNGNTTHVFKEDSEDGYDVRLTITDPSGISCANPPDSNKLNALDPSWKEVVPRNY